LTISIKKYLLRTRYVLHCQAMCYKLYKARYVLPECAKCSALEYILNTYTFLCIHFHIAQPNYLEIHSVECFFNPLSDSVICRRIKRKEEKYTLCRICSSHFNGWLIWVVTSSDTSRISCTLSTPVSPLSHINIFGYSYRITPFSLPEQSMGARNRLGIGLSYWPAMLHRLAESILLNRFLGSLKV
jgi:hypothetical protein